MPGSRRIAVALAALAAFGLPPRAPAQEAAPDWVESPWDGYLPDPAEPVVRQDEGGSWQGPDRYACRIRDAAGRPLPGARLLRVPELTVGNIVRPDQPIGEAVADAEGIASLPTTPGAWHFDCHWVASAPGLAPAYTYGPAPDHEFRLEPAASWSVRLLGPLGEPVAGASVSLLAGCSHGPPVAHRTTGADGTAAFEGPRRSLQYWIEGPGIASDLHPVGDNDSLGDLPTVLLADAGEVYRGRTVDLRGEPVAGVVVRSWTEQRGPATLSGTDGTFVLRGVEPGASLALYHPGDLRDTDADRYLRDAHPEFPIVATVGPLGVVPQDASARVRVVAVDTSGAPLPGIALRVVHEATGRGPTTETSDPGEPDPEDPDAHRPGIAMAAVPPGPCVILPADPFQPHAFAPVRVEAKAGAVVEGIVRPVPRPVLRLSGTIPEGADVRIRVEGADGRDTAEDGMPVPAEGRAAVQVRIEGAPPFHFPLGPVRDGVREAVVAVPPPRLVVPPAGARRATLARGHRGVLHRRAADGTLETWATGRVSLRWSPARGRHLEAPVDLPAAPGGSVAVRAEDAVPFHEEVEVRLEAAGADGEWAPVEIVEAEPGQAVVFRDEGLQTLRAVAPASGALSVRRGPCRIRLEILDRHGDPADALVSVDGEIHAAPAGVLDLGGLDPGPHRLLVAERDADDGGVEVRCTVAADAPLRRTVRLRDP